MRDRRARHDARANNRGRSQRPSAEGIRKCALEGSESIFMPSKYRGETSCERLENIGCRWEPEEGCYFLDGYNDNMREYLEANKASRAKMRGQGGGRLKRSKRKVRKNTKRKVRKNTKRKVRKNTKRNKM